LALRNAPALNGLIAEPLDSRGAVISVSPDGPWTPVLCLSGGIIRYCAPAFLWNSPAGQGFMSLLQIKA
jgi:hypothetical protein